MNPANSPQENPASSRSAAAEDLLPLVYDELRRLARARMANTPPGNTLQPTALVNEAYLRLARSHQGKWNSRGHFFASAAEAMRQILVEQVRHKSTGKAGGDLRREDLEGVEITAKERPQEILAIDEALTRLEDLDPDKAAVVKLRVFAGFSREEAAEALELSLRTCDRHWRYAIACMHRDLSQE